MTSQPQEMNYVPYKVLHPVPVQQHEFFGQGFLRQHMVMDDRWTPNSLTEEYQQMTELLENRLQFYDLENKVNSKKRAKKFYTLKNECREGRSFLNNIRIYSDKQAIRNILMNHRHMLRLYQHMPVDMVEENINQRTFVQRKERDRLRSRLEKVKKLYEEKLLQRGLAENRLRYQDQYTLQEEINTKELKKKIINSETRLDAVRTINSTYKKIIKILRHDEIFYEPILRSLDNDIKDQETFIEYILHLGTPALRRFKELSEQYRIMADRSRKTIQMSIQECASFRRSEQKESHKSPKLLSHIGYKVRRYVRETRSMLELKSQLEEIKTNIRKIKFSTYSSMETEMYPRIKTQVVNNLKLISKIDNDLLENEALDTKMKCGTVLKEVLKNNLSEDGLLRLERLKAIREAITLEDQYQEETLAHIKNHSDCFVLLRFALWNIHDILRHVGPRRMPFVKYPVEYLKLPLLKYEMLNMQACPPDPFEVDIPTLLKVVQHKLRIVMQAFDEDISPRTMDDFKSNFCTSMVGVAEVPSISSMVSQIPHQIPHQTGKKSSHESDLMDKVKLNQMVPNRKHIKLASARLVEGRSRKDE